MKNVEVGQFVVWPVNDTDMIAFDNPLTWWNDSKVAHVEAIKDSKITLLVLRTGKTFTEAWPQEREDIREATTEEVVAEAFHTHATLGKQIEAAKTALTAMTVHHDKMVRLNVNFSRRLPKSAGIVARM